MGKAYPHPPLMRNFNQSRLHDRKMTHVNAFSLLCTILSYMISPLFAHISFLFLFAPHDTANLLFILSLSNTRVLSPLLTLLDTYAHTHSLLYARTFYVHTCTRTRVIFLPLHLYVWTSILLRKKTTKRMEAVAEEMIIWFTAGSHILWTSCCIASFMFPLTHKTDRHNVLINPVYRAGVVVKVLFFLSLLF